MSLCQSITETIGRTPLLELKGLEKELGLTAQIFAKLECFNPGGSIKDRAALSMIKTAQAEGKLLPGGLIVEPTSGNTGIGLALVARALGFRTVLTMPESMSVERRMMLKTYGAEIVLTPASLGMSGAVDKAKEIVASTLGAFMPNQFDNAANAKAHYETTGPEIWDDMQGRIDAFVSAVGSGGTITGTGQFLRRCDPGIRVVAVEPKGSPVLSGGKAGPHKIQGIGAGFVPGTLDTSVYHEVMQVGNEEAAAMTRLVLKTDGVFVGISSGSALEAAVRLARKPPYDHGRIVVIFPDSGERYLSTGLFSE